MKTTFDRFLTLVALLSLFVVSGRANTAAHAQIIKEREAVFSEIVAYHESQFTNGLSDGKALLAAQLALRTFRRDIAATVPEKIKQQELIVQTFEKELAIAKVRVISGVASRLDILTATDALLQAKQALEEFRVNERKS